MGTRVIAERPSRDVPSGRDAPATPQHPNGASWTLWFALLLGVSAVTHLWLSLRLSVNWDEFWFLSHVYQYRDGSLETPLQTFHVHFFEWLTHLSANEVEQIVAARLSYLVLLALSIYLLFRISRTFLSVQASCFVALCVGTYSNVLYHGTSFRADGLALCLLLATVSLLLARERGLGHLLAAALFASTAAMVTVKSAFYAPLILTALVLGHPDLVGHLNLREATRRTIPFLASSLLSFTVLYVWHSGTLVSRVRPDSMEYLQNAATKVLFHQMLFPTRGYIARTMLANPLFWTLLGFALVLLVQRLARRERLAESILLLALASPLASLVLYRNAFSYYYLFILPPAAVLCGMAYDRLVVSGGDLRPTQRLVRLLLVAGTLVPLLRALTTARQDETLPQRAVIDAVHAIFPTPVPYIDRNGMIASFPKAGFFMSRWGMETYHQRAVPVFPDVLRQLQPPLLITNIDALRDAVDTSSTRPVTDLPSLLPTDAETLRSSFVHHWGPIYVAGKRLVLPSHKLVAFALHADGAYTVESDSSVILDGVEHRPGDVILLAAGDHVAQSPGRDATVVLRWGRHLHRPPEPPPTAPLYVGFTGAR